jgi:phosphoserine aminotransferase
LVIEPRRRFAAPLAGCCGFDRLPGMTHRVINFNAGPSALPLPALERAQRELLDFQGTGMSIMEHSHRGKDYERVHDEAIKLVTELLSVPESHQVLFMQGGASTQFALVPMNLRSEEHAGDYVITGTWSQKAYDEAKIVGKPAIAADPSHDGRFSRIPKQSELKLSGNAPYVHITTNNTIFGTQYFDFPSTGKTPLIADMSSDIMWRPIDVSRFGLIYAGAQKNAGPAGLTFVIVRDDLIGKAAKGTPTVMDYKLQADADSMLNTPAAYAMYIAGLVFKWLKQLGGLPEIEKRNIEKSRLLYDFIDSSALFHNPVAREDRSRMNVPFTLKDSRLDEEFLKGAAKRGMVQLKGHRSVGGMRASIYNAMPIEGLRALVEYMKEFEAQHG